MVSDLCKTNGEATANNRKGKLIFFYEWELELEWQGQVTSGSNMMHQGKIYIPNLSEENELHEIDVNVTVNESNDESELLKEFMYNVGRERIREQLGIYIKNLKEEYSRNLILPKKDSLNCTNNKPSAKAGECQNSGNAKDNCNSKTLLNKDGGSSVVKGSTNVINAASNQNQIGCKLDVRTLDMVEDFQCSQDDLYHALTRVEMLSAFTRTPAKADNCRGGE